MNETKMCTKCKVVYENTLEFFCRTNNGKPASMCKKCKAIYGKERYLKNKEVISEKTKLYTENNKQKISEKRKVWRQNNAEKIRQYRIDNAESIRTKQKEYREKRKDELHKIKREWNKNNKKYVQEYRLKNKERDRESAKKWASTEKGHEMKLESTRRRRERLKNLLNNFSDKDWKDCLIHFDNKCVYCGENAKLEHDHFVPVVKDGHYTKNNILCACRRCNASKDDDNFYTWYPLQNFYTKEREIKILKYLGKLGGDEVAI